VELCGLHRRLCSHRQQAQECLCPRRLVRSLEPRLLLGKHGGDRKSKCYKQENQVQLHGAPATEAGECAVELVLLQLLPRDLAGIVRNGQQVYMGVEDVRDDRVADFVDGDTLQAAKSCKAPDPDPAALGRTW
jgi:hypothetical protein